jgi:CubicO group peptidase (beta-lactamase class C family)
MTTRVVLLSLVACVCPWAQTPTISERLDSLLRKFDRNDAPGVAAMVIYKGQVAYQRGFGMADLENKIPITPQTQFLLASLSKQFTAMGIMIAREQGKLRYDDPLSKFVPEFPEYAGRITVRHLLLHLSGLPDYEEILVGKIGSDFFRPATSPPAAHDFTAAEALAALARQPKLRFEPGAKYDYSNSGYVVLGQILERATHMRYAEFLERNIFAPLAMKDSLVYDERKQKAPLLALSYQHKDGWRDISYSPLNCIYGEDNVITTLEDLFRWDQALYSEKLVPRAAIEEAFTSGKTAAGKETGYGFGWMIQTKGKRRILEHAGAWAGYRTYIRRVPEDQLTIALLFNRSDFRFEPAEVVVVVDRIIASGAASRDEKR